MERVRKLLFEEWIPRLEEISAAHAAALERQRSVIGGSSRTKMPQVRWRGCLRVAMQPRPAAHARG